MGLGEAKNAIPVHETARLGFGLRVRAAGFRVGVRVRD